MYVYKNENDRSINDCALNKKNGCGWMCVLLLLIVGFCQNDDKRWIISDIVHENWRYFDHHHPTVCACMFCRTGLLIHMPGDKSEHVKLNWNDWFTFNSVFNLFFCTFCWFEPCALCSNQTFCLLLLMNYL